MKIIELLSISETQWEEFRELFAELNPSIIVNKEKIVKALESPETNVFVLLDGDEHIIGSATLCVSDLPTGRIASVEAVVVKSQYRGQGLGKMLMEHVIEYARREFPGIAIHLTSNPNRVAANEMYKSIGFQKVDTNVYRMEV